MKDTRERAYITVDAVVFTVYNNRLMVLVEKRSAGRFSGWYALPGGHVEKWEDPDITVKRELKEETGLNPKICERFKTYAAPRRVPDERVVTISYLSFIQYDKAKIKPQLEEVSKVEFKDVKTIKKLAFDHKEILNDALNYIQKNANWKKRLNL